MGDGVSKYTRMSAMWGIVVSALCFVLTSKVYGLEESTGPGGSNSAAVHQLGVMGEGVNVGFIAASNIRTTHEAFKDSNGITHAFNYDFSGDGISITAHDTQLAGIVISRGSAAYPNEIGVAPSADLYCARLANNSGSISSDWFVNALDELINNQNCRVIVTGFELTGSSDANGDNPWTRLYDYYAYQYGVIFINAAGNQNIYVTIFGDGYNGITTGGLRLNDVNNPFEYRRVGSSSGSGLTADGRRKPEITAPSQSQTVPTYNSDTSWTTIGSTGGETSWAIPHAAGAAALLLGLADTTPGPNDNNSNVIKAIIVNSTMPNVKNKAGLSTNPADPCNTWHKDRGYGRLDCLRAYQLLDTNELEPGATITQDRGWGLGRIGQNVTNVYTIHIPQRSRLIATTTWQRRIAWNDTFPIGVLEPDELTGYLANLDMTVYSPYEPNAVFNKIMFGYSTNDNLIKCDLPILTPGDYTIEISNNSTTNETANYGLAVELHPIMQGDLPNVDYNVNFKDFSILAADWLSSTSSLDLLLSPDGTINLIDLDLFADDWLKIDPLYFQY